jgi:hypothetical protein
METKQQTKTDDFQLGVYLMDIRVRHPECRSYEDQSRALMENYGIDISPRELWLREESTVEEEQQDNELIYKNIGI